MERPQWEYHMGIAARSQKNHNDVTSSLKITRSSISPFSSAGKHRQDDNLKQRPSHKPDSIKLIVLPFNSFSPFKNFSLIYHNQNALSFINHKAFANQLNSSRIDKKKKKKKEKKNSSSICRLLHEVQKYLGGAACQVCQFRF